MIAIERNTYFFRWNVELESDRHLLRICTYKHNRVEEANTLRKTKLKPIIFKRNLFVFDWVLQISIGDFVIRLNKYRNTRERDKKHVAR